MAYHSQFGQDVYLHNAYFRDKRNGVFLDVGAYDGRMLSNTYFFERERGWTGICIEPTPSVFARLATNRPDATCLNVAAADYDGDADFLEVDAIDATNLGKMLSGLTENLDPKHREMIENNNKATKTIRVPVRHLGRILEEHEITHVDYCSIDTEGSELKALSSVDFDRVSIDAITIEVHRGGPVIDAFFAESGFTHVRDFADYERLYVRPSLVRLPTTTAVISIGPKELGNPALLAQHRRTIVSQSVPVERFYYVYGADQIPPHLGGRVVVGVEAKPLSEVWEMASTQAETPFLLPLDAAIKLAPDAVETLERDLWSGKPVVSAPVKGTSGSGETKLFAWRTTTRFVGGQSAPAAEQPSSLHWLAAMQNVSRALAGKETAIDNPVGRMMATGT